MGGEWPARGPRTTVQQTCCCARWSSVLSPSQPTAIGSVPQGKSKAPGDLVNGSRSHGQVAAQPGGPRSVGQQEAHPDPAGPRAEETNAVDSKLSRAVEERSASASTITAEL